MSGQEATGPEEASMQDCIMPLPLSNPPASHLALMYKSGILKHKMQDFFYLILLKKQTNPTILAFVSTVYIEYCATSSAGFMYVMVHEFFAEHLSVILLLCYLLFYVRESHVIRQRVVSEIYKPARNSILFSRFQVMSRNQSVKQDNLCLEKRK